MNTSSPEVQCLVSLLTLVSQTARTYTCTACTCTLPEKKHLYHLVRWLGGLVYFSKYNPTEVYFSKHKPTGMYFHEYNPTEVKCLVSLLTIGQNSNPCTGSLILGSLVLGSSVLGLKILCPRIEDPQSWDYGSLVLGLRILSPRIEDP